MSTFSGKMREYNLVSIDRFDGKNLESSVYFLSHNHADHTIGLDSSAFQYRMLSNSRLKLYCSNITRDLLLLNNKYKSLKDSIVALEVNEPHTITLIDPQSGKDKENVTVTLLPAEHCPGSVMFLFEGSQGTVLYTGDFRLSRKDLSNMKHLHSGSRPKEIRSIYVDTTFCVPQAIFIPERDESVQAIINIIHEWILLSDHHLVNIRHKAVLGYEHLFKKLSQHFNMKVHVHPNKYEMYEKVGDMTAYTTPDPKGTQIHACRIKFADGSSSLAECGLPSGSSNMNLRNIAVSTMCFVQKVSLETYAKRFSDNFFRVCYSFHPSYCEVRDMILYLQPQQAFASVIPPGETLDTIQQRIDHFVNLAKQSAKNSNVSQHKAIGRLKVRKRKLAKQKLSQQSDESLGLEFGDIGDSPGQCKRHRVEGDSQLNMTTPDGHTPQTLPGEIHNNSETFTPLSHEQDINETQSSDASDPAMNSCSESNDEGSRDSFVLRLSLSQDDDKAMESFTPKLQDSYGSLLGYISETGSDDVLELDDEKPAGHNVLPDADLTLDGRRLDEGDLSSGLPMDCNAMLTGSSSADGAKRSGKALAKSIRKDSQECSNSAHSMGERNSSNSARCSDISSSLDEELSDREMTKTADGLKGILCRALDAGGNASANSSDVILLEDDEHGAASTADDTSQERIDEVDDRRPQSKSNGNNVVDGCSEDGKDGTDVVNENGKSTSQGPVTCTIDLTQMDEDDDVYPSTSGQPCWYNYGGQNRFSRFSHPAVQQTALGRGGGMDVDNEEVEYSEKEVACSDEECECGGKSKGGTHKYMVPRPKKSTSKFVPFQINWQIDSDGSDEDSLLELPAHVRTRKWIESQSLYMQRQHYLNSQAASNSEVIVIDSDDEESEQKTTSENLGGKLKLDKGEERLEKAVSRTDLKEMSEKSDDSDKMDSDRITGNPSSGKPDEKMGTDEPGMNQQCDNNIREAPNKEKDSLSIDLSLTSCPTNLSVLAQASDMSLKSANVNDISELRRTVNGDGGSHADNNMISSYRQTRHDDKASSS